MGPTYTAEPGFAMQKGYWILDVSWASVARVPVYLHDNEEIALLRKAGRVAANTLRMVSQRISEGITTAQIDEWVRLDTKRQGALPSQLGYHGFPAAVCTSRNEVVCHGIPSDRERLCNGDIINVDVTSELNGFHGDTSATFFIGQPSDEARRLVDTTRRCLEAAIAEVRPNARLGDLGAAICELASNDGFSVVTAFGGHGIGRKMHMPPHVDHVGRRGLGLRLKAGMAFTIEPMLAAGAPDVEVLDDGWTVVTKDRKLSAQFEHTVLVTNDGCEVLT